MKWTTKQPRVSGYYWLKSTFIGVACIVKVKIRNLDTEWPEQYFILAGSEMEHDLSELDRESKWAGPIPPPSN